MSQETERLERTVRAVFRMPEHITPWMPDFDEAMADARRGVPSSGWDTFSPEQREQLAGILADAHWRRAAGTIGVPTRLLDASMASTRRTPALERVATYLAGEYERGACLVLTGPTGVGKSYAAVAALRALPTQPRRFRYFPSLCGALLDPGRRKDALEETTTTRLLVLDDLGVEYVKEGGLIDTFLDEIIWTREGEYRPTIITTNLTTDALKQRLPGRLIDRLAGEWGRVYGCPGESLRGQDCAG